MEPRVRDQTITFVRSCELDVPISFKMCACDADTTKVETADFLTVDRDAFEGNRKKKPLSEILRDPRARFAGLQQESVLPKLYNNLTFTVTDMAI